MMDDWRNSYTKNAITKHCKPARKKLGIAGNYVNLCVGGTPTRFNLERGCGETNRYNK